MWPGRIIVVSFVLTIACAAAAPDANQSQAGEMSALMLLRGESALSLGNISGARRLLMMPAMAGNAQAERRLAETYDPVWLAKHNAHPLGSLSDPNTALTWYERAADQGDSEAARYLGRDSPADKTP